MEKTDDIKKISDQVFEMHCHIEELYRRNESRGIMSDAVVEQINRIHSEIDNIKYRLKAAESKIEVIANKAFLAIETLYPGRNHAEVSADEALTRIVEESRKKPKA
jgi:hypothetical protein